MIIIVEKEEACIASNSISVKPIPDPKIIRSIGVNSPSIIPDFFEFAGIK